MRPCSAHGILPRGDPLTTSRPALRRVAAAVLLAVAAAAMVVVGPERVIAAVVQTAREAGPVGAVVYGLAYVLATVLVLPGSILTLGAGFLWGPIGGFLVVWPGATAGATAAFLLGRTLLRDRVEAWVSGRARLSALDSAVGRRGLVTVTLLRLSPLIPFNLLNYALGLTSISARDYVVGTAVGMIPGIFLYAAAGAGLGDLAAVLEGGEVPRSAVLTWLGIAATLVVTVVLARTARRVLDAELDAGDG